MLRKQSYSSTGLELKIIVHDVAGQPEHFTHSNLQSNSIDTFRELINEFPFTKKEKSKIQRNYKGVINSSDARFCEYGYLTGHPLRNLTPRILIVELWKLHHSVSLAVI